MNFGNIYSDQGNYFLANEYLQKSLIIWKNINDKEGLANCYSNLGIVNYYLGNHPLAVQNYLMSLKIYEELAKSTDISIANSGKKGMSDCCNNIGVIHQEQGNYSQAIVYDQKSLKIREDLNDIKGMSYCYNNLGNVYYYKGDYPLAIKYYLKSLKIKEEVQDLRGMSLSYNNIGNIYGEQGNYRQAMEYFQKSKKIREQQGNMQGLSEVLGNMASLSNKFEKYDEAIQYASKSLNLAKEIGSLDDEKMAYTYLSESYEKTGNATMALSYYKQYTVTKDSLFNAEKNKQITEMDTRYQSEKKQNEIEILNKDKELQKIEIKWQTTQKYAYLGSFALMLILALVILFSYRKIKVQKFEIQEKNEALHQQNAEIAAQRDEIEAQRDLVIQQKDHIEEQKKKITDSINYAKRIQQAVLPTGDSAYNILGEHFILFKPKDIVSGDFYWGTRINEWLIVTVADCTGHGVPGAFMSMLGVSFLNEIVRKKEITRASEVLDNLRESIIGALQQKGKPGEQKDGMDIVFCAINTQTNLLQFAGANNPLFIVTASKELRVVEPDNQPVSIYEKMKPFTNHEIQLNSGDCIYLASDGFEDQFGGQKNRKFMVKKMKELMVDISDKPMVEQDEIFNRTFENWKSNNEQIDDVTILGFKI